MTCVVIHSGGLDSTALIRYLEAEGFDVLSLGFDYGQRHKRELDYASLFCERYGIPRKVIHLPFMTDLGGSSQTDPSIPVPHGHYTDESMKVTVIPNRNMIMLSVAVAYAISRQAHTVAYAAHAGDHAIYPDCRPQFVSHLAHAVDDATGADQHVDLIAPFISKSKAQILQDTEPFNYKLTYSCYEGQAAHCGRCGTCVERREAFVLAGIADPTEYKS